MPYSVKMYILLWVAKKLGLDNDVTIPQHIMDLCNDIRSFIMLSETEGNEKGWDGESKRRLVMARLKRDKPELICNDLGLAIELVVRTIKDS